MIKTLCVLVSILFPLSAYGAAFDDAPIQQSMTSSGGLQPPLGEWGKVPKNTDLKRWKMYHKDNLGVWLFDRDSITRNKSIVGVWTTIYPSEFGRYKFSNKYDCTADVYKIFFITEYKCNENKYREPKIIAYSYWNIVLKEINNSTDSNSWDYIEPESLVDNLFKRVCTNPKKPIAE